MNIEFNTENFHDSYIISVLENTETDETSMLIDFPVNWHESIYEKRKLLFFNSFNYQVNEIRFSGSPQILDIEIVDKTNDWIRFRLNTNAGYREISCETVDLIEDSNKTL